MRSEEYRLLVQRLGLPQDPQDAYDDLVFAEDYGEHEEEVTKRVKPRFLECLRSRGEGHWADLDGTRRREGALALYHFLGRCSRLSYLDIYAFDFGEAPGISPVQIPPLLSLTDVKMSNIDSAASHFILSHTPNLESLSITTDWDEQFEAFALSPLPKLRTITLDLFSNENLPLLIDIIDACGPALRELSFNFSEWHMEQDIPNILRKVPQLGSLSIYMDWEHFERRRGKTLPTYPLLRALSSSALTSIYLSCHPSLPILISLPPTLVSLDLEWIPDTRPWHPVTLNISEILQVVLGLKRTSRHRRWKLCILQYYPESDEGMDPAVAGLLDAAKEAGLKVVI